MKSKLSINTEERNDLLDRVNHLSGENIPPKVMTRLFEKWVVLYQDELLTMKMCKICLNHNNATLIISKRMT